jgi:ferritin
MLSLKMIQALNDLQMPNFLSMSAYFESVQMKGLANWMRGAS